MVEDLNMDIDVQIMPTVREADGLAMSSRNAYLTPEERSRASVLYRSLCAAKDLFASSQSGGGTVEAEQLREAVRSVLSSEPLVQNVQT